MAQSSETNSWRGTEEAREAALKLLRIELDLYQRLEACGRRQRALVTQDDVSPLLALLAQRQKITDQLARIGEALGPIRRNWSGVRAVLTAAQRAEAERFIAESEACLERLMSADEQDARILGARKEAAAKALRDSHAFRSVASAYGPQDSVGVLDTTDEVMS